jgi:hypothetical protein
MRRFIPNLFHIFRSCILFFMNFQNIWMDKYNKGLVCCFSLKLRALALLRWTGRRQGSCDSEGQSSAARGEEVERFSPVAWGAAEVLPGRPWGTAAALSCSSRGRKYVSVASDEAVELGRTQQWRCGSSPPGRRRRCAQLHTVGKAHWRARDSSCRTGVTRPALALGSYYAAAVR